MPTGAPPERIGAALRHWRRLNGIKQLAFAADFGVSQATVSRWEAGVAPSNEHAKRLRALLSARPSTSADHALCRLIETSREPYFLVCDATHTLLAASPRRALEWHVPATELVGTSLWRFATPEIAEFEEALGARGWFDTIAPELKFETRGAEYDEITIHQGWRRVVRVQLSDGRHARLVSDCLE